MSVEDIIESSDVLSSKQESRGYIDGNLEYWRDLYGGKEILAVAVDGSPEIAAAYEPGSDNNQRQALDAVKQFYPRSAYHSITTEVLE